MPQSPAPSHTRPPVRPEHRPAAEPGLRGLSAPRRDPAGPDTLDAGVGHCTVSKPASERISGHHDQRMTLNAMDLFRLSVAVFM